MDTVSDSEGETIVTMSDGNTEDGESQVNKVTKEMVFDALCAFATLRLKPTLDFTTVSDNTEALLKNGEHAKDDTLLVTTKQAHDLLCRRRPQEWAKQAFLARQNAPKLEHFYGHLIYTV
ncbi:hypothetical protein OC844_006805 [Tilletia horrida]|nr:hypothetical protein OC844_006805 [Tilletia horrida]